MSPMESTARQQVVHTAKLPPQNLEAERAVLGAILIDNEGIHKVLEFLTARDFYREGNACLFEAMVALSQKNEPTDFVTVSNYLESQGQLETVGGASYLASLTDSIPSSANVVSYAKIIREKSVIRQLINAAAEITTLGYEGSEDAETLLDSAEKVIFEISENRTRASFASIKEIVKISYKRLEQLAENPGDVTGLTTGFAEFDKMTSGLQPSDLIILAGRPSMGKTALALNMAENAAIGGKAKVAVFSLEMSKEQLVTRMLCSQARIDSSKLRGGRLEERDWPSLMRAAGLLSEIEIYIDDTPAPTVIELRAKARRLKREKGLDLIVIDYLQLMRGSANVKSREQEISEISRSLKSLAKELSVPVIALSQLNRAVENRTNRRPQMADLRESGAIEQDADVIVFIYRDEVYDPNTPDKGVAEVIIGKQRNGPIGTCRLAFLNNYTKFENLAYDPNAGAFEPAGE